MGDKYIDAFRRQMEQARMEQVEKYKAQLETYSNEQLQLLGLAAVLNPLGSSTDYKDALAELLIERANLAPESKPAASDQPVYICLACGEEIGSIERCNQCGSPLVSLVSVLEQHYGPDWRAHVKLVGAAQERK